MVLFGGSSGGDTSGSDFGSKLRTPSYSSELDLSSDPASTSMGGGSLDSFELAGGDLQKSMQIEQQKATLMSQVRNLSKISGK